MAHYDRLRANGLSAPEAMGHAAPFFARRPNVHDAWAAPERGALEPGAPDTPAWAATTPGHSDGQDEAWRMEQRCRRIIEQLQAQARAAGRNELEDAELRTVLENLTNAPGHIIAASVERDRKRRTTAGLADLATDDRTDVVHRARAPKTVNAEAHRAAAGNPARASAMDFPHNVRETVATAAQRGIEPSDPARTRRQTPDSTRRRGRR